MPSAIAITTSNRLSYTLVGAPDLGTLGEGYDTSSPREIENGTGPDQADAAWTALVTIPASTVLSLDLTNLVSSKFGFVGYVNMSVLKDVFVINKETEAGRYVLWGVSSPSDITGYSARINRNGDFRWTDYTDGVAINSGNKILYCANPGINPVTLEIAMAGVGTYNDNV
jgi:hypothetical protein